MLASLLRFINEQHGIGFSLGGRYPTGEHGAFAISESDGHSARRFVLKWWPGTVIPDELRQAMTVTARLSAVGYPAPRYLLVGVAQPLRVVYSIQEELPGALLGGRLDAKILDHLLELNALQEGQAMAPTLNWPRPVVDSVLYGGDGFCQLEPLLSYSGETAALLGVLQQLAAAGGAEQPPNGDVVHFDFQGANILFMEDKVVGVVDWEGWRSGDRAFDLATLFFYAGARRGAEASEVERLWRLLVEQIGARLLGVYLAHLILRQVDWSIRFHDRNVVEQWLGRANDVLRRLSAAGGQGAGA